jgi:hypothetical protein
MYMVAPKTISAAYLIKPSYQSMCLCISLLSYLDNGSVKCTTPFIARQRSGKMFPQQRNCCARVSVYTSIVAG